MLKIVNIYLLSAFFLVVTNLSYGEQLPKNIKWQTNDKAPVFADYAPTKGGEFRDYILSYPQTFRLYGPNSNSGGFVSYNRKWAFLSLVARHPSTFEHIPQLATHWAIMPDQKTVYYKLDPDAKWSDSKPITAQDYVFAFNFLQSEHIQAPFYNQYVRDHFAEVTAIDKHTLKIVSPKASWNVLDVLDLSPLPEHAIKLDKDWIKNYQWSANVVPGPYVISDFEKGRYVVFSRIKDWWGYNKRYFKEKYHFDKIRLEVIQTEETAYEQFKKGQLSIFNPTPLVWVNKTNIDQINNGYILKQRIFVDQISGARGFFFNAQDPIWGDPILRQAFAYTIDFDTLNKNFLYNLYQRKDHFFDVIAPYKNESIKTYPFNLSKAEQLIKSAGWQRNPNNGFYEKNGQRLSLTIVTGSDTALLYLPFIKEIATKAGIDVFIKKYDGAQFFDLVNDRKFQVMLLGFGGGLFPSPRQFLHTENLQAGTNNIFMFGNEQIDKWIDTYEFDLDEDNRVQAMHNIEKSIHDSAVYIPFWKEPATRILFWRYIKGPANFVYKSGLDIDLLYFDAAEQEKVSAAMSKKDKLPIAAAEFDPYNLKAAK